MSKREIKFRVWDDTLGMCDDPIIGGSHSVKVNEAMNKGAIGVVMQYTGLKDRNDKEIYEGDKLSFTVFDCFDNDTQYEGVVVFSGSRFMIWNKPDKECFGSDGGFDLDWVVMQDDELEIIGNIYDI